MVVNAPAPQTAPSISLVLLNRNHGIYLRRSLQALIEQTRPADEIVVIDDASTDDSVAIINSIAAGAPNLRLIRNPERLGVVGNLNKGLGETRGDYVGFHAADDLVFPTFIEQSLSQLVRHREAGFAAACVEIWDARDRRIGLRPLMRPSARAGYVGPARFRRLIGGADNFFVGGGVLYRRSAIAALGGFDPTLGAMCDGILTRRIAARSGFCFIPETLGVWRIHSDNYSVAMATSAQDTQSMIRRSTEVLGQEPEGLFPHDYAERLSRRIRFGSGRLLLLREGALRGAARDHLVALAGGSRLDALALGAAARLGPLRSAAALVWLTMRLRPFSLLQLISDQVRRRLASRRS
jgi:glycosyltransferase involved in cell wall biosynthesis